MPYRLLKHGKEHIGAINPDFKVGSIKQSVRSQIATTVKKLNQSKGLQNVSTGFNRKFEGNFY